MPHINKTVTKTDKGTTVRYYDTILGQWVTIFTPSPKKRTS